MRILLVSVLACLAVAPFESSANDPDEIEFKLASDLLPPGVVTLSNGVIVDPEDWSTTILASIPRSSDPSAKQPTCTATLVGPRALITAAHCLDSPLSAKARPAYLSVDGVRAKLECDMHPEYLAHEYRLTVPRSSTDYAICKIVFGSGIPNSIATLSFEVIDSSPLRAGENVLMTGYGCSELRLVDGELDWDPSDKLFRVGDGSIEAEAGSIPNEQDYVTIRSKSGLSAAVCPGDSGGALFSGVTTTSPSTKRRVRGVNSAVSKSRSPTSIDIISKISALSSERFTSWINEWATKNGKEVGVICGINTAAGMGACRE